MDEKKNEFIIKFDHGTKSAIIIRGTKTETIPFPIYSQREAEIIGKKYFRSVCWKVRS